MTKSKMTKKHTRSEDIDMRGNSGDQPQFGLNRTSKDLAPRRAKEMFEGTEELTLPRCPKGSDKDIAENRIRYMKEVKGESVGSVPIPATWKGAVNAGKQLLEGADPKLFVDKLGERLAFERTGVRIYDALISKYKAEEDWLKDSGVTLERLEHFRDEEQEHFFMLAEVIAQLGGDPTAVTPAADMAAVASAGIVRVLGESRINFLDSLDAILVAELSDNDCWGFLVSLARDAGLKEVASRFEDALKSEQEHLSSVREWIYQLRLGKSMSAAA